MCRGRQGCVVVSRGRQGCAGVGSGVQVRQG